MSNFLMQKFTSILIFHLSMVNYDLLYQDLSYIPWGSCHLSRRPTGCLGGPTWWHWPHWYVPGMIWWACPGPADTHGCTDQWSRRRRRCWSASPHQGLGLSGRQTAAYSGPRMRPRWWWSCVEKNACDKWILWRMQNYTLFSRMEKNISTNNRYISTQT